MFAKLFSTSTVTPISIKLNNSIIPLLNNSYVINLIGSEDNVEQTANEINYIATISYGLSTKIISIVPSCLSLNPINKPLTWRVELEQILNTSNEHVIINKVGNVNCDEITDLNRSIRALNIFRHPLAFLINPNAKTRHDVNYSYFRNCSQINQVWPLLATHENKVKELELYITPIMN